MRVLMVSQRYWPGHFSGAPGQARTLAHALTARGISVEILTATQAGPALDPGHQGHRGTPIPIHRLKKPRLPRGDRAWNFAAALSWASRHAPRFDVVHGHAASSLVMGTMAGSRLRGISAFIKPSLGGKSGDLARILASPLLPLLKPILQGGQAYQTLNAEIETELRAMGCNPDRFFRIPNAVDGQRFKALDPEERAAGKAARGWDEPCVFLFVGQLISRKGIESLLAAWEPVSRAQGARLVIVGDGPKRQRVEEAARSLPRLEYLHTQEKPEGLLPLCDALVLPSRHEGDANTVLEAAACGLSMIVTSAALPRDRNPPPGFWEVGGPSPLSLARAMEDFLQTPEQVRLELGARQRTWVQDRFLERITGEVLAVYEEIS
jgi:glycosyltransferase involved in cell wall biosynthesis